MSRSHSEIAVLQPMSHLHRRFESASTNSGSRHSLLLLSYPPFTFHLPPAYPSKLYHSLSLAHSFFHSYPSSRLLPMPFSKTSVSRPQTAKSLARMHVQAHGTSHQTVMSWLQPRKAARWCMGYRQPGPTAPTAPPTTVRLLSTGSGHSSPNTAASPTDTACSHIDTLAVSGRSKAISSPLFQAGVAPQPLSEAGATPPSAPTKKSHRQRIVSGSPQLASSSPGGPFGRELVSPSPKLTAASYIKRTAPFPILCARAGSPAAKRRQGVPVFADEIQVILKDVLLLKDREEQEEHLLRRMLAGSVVGGEGKYQRMKMLPPAGPY
ncbi:hypothetical protein C8F04DRAFT_1086346 [Mycena alexandri]|uniref:Uncharacterized protein n=1 Tax=Mycena alexandri TaxID=1745969 RepID=A0AAD6T4M3_9AGAR|nr:hypothetical protein C8F04DRAFT_1086346 [Mycena alexandri]